MVFLAVDTQARNSRAAKPGRFIGQQTSSEYHRGGDDGLTPLTNAALLDNGILTDVRDALTDQEARPNQGEVNAGSANGLVAALAATGRVLGSDTLRDLTVAARAELSGAGPLQPFLDQDGVTDVLVNRYNEIWVERHGVLELLPLSLGSEGGLRALAVRLAALAGQRLDDAAPICDGTLPDGTRLHAVLPPLATHGALISLRVHRPSQFDLRELARRQMVPPAWVPLLVGLVANRANVLISGGTGTGKTTLLGALLTEAAPGERLVTVEEARELAPPVSHHVPLIARRPNVEGAGEVTLADLVRAALRMRPDRLVLGECRAGEVREVLQALNTGHEGGMATLHANNAAAVPARLEALGALAGMTREAVAAQTVGAIDVVLQLRRRGGVRFISEIGAPVRVDGELQAAVIASWDGVGEPAEAQGWEAFSQRWGS